MPRPDRFVVVDYFASDVSSLPPKLQDVLQHLGHAIEILTEEFNTDNPRLPREETIELLKSCYRLKDAMGLVPPTLRGPDDRSEGPR